MDLIISSISTSVVNLIIFSLIPFLWWFSVTGKKPDFSGGWDSSVRTYGANGGF